MDTQVNVLIVDDQPPHRPPLATMLEALGARLVTVPSGEEAVARLRDEQFAVVVLGIQTPGPEGFDQAALLRLREQSRDVPVVVLAAGDPATWSAASDDAQGVVDYLPTPLVPQLLRSKVRVFVDLFEKTLALAVAREHRSRFVARMSHELRTPLNSVIGFAELLRDQDSGSLDEQQLAFVNHIHTAGSRLLSVVNDVLDLASVAAGKMELHVEPVNVRETLTSIGDLLRPDAERQSLILTVHPVDADVQVMADAVRFRQVLSHLLGNAIKFTPAGGHVEVRADPLPDAVCIHVEDDGIGIAEADQDRIFEEFHQVDSALSRQFQGAGLGLALTRRLLRLQDGDIAVASAPGKGSTFTVTLPRRVERDAASLAAAPPADSQSLLFDGAYFEKRLREEVARGRRYDRRFSVVFVSIDQLSAFAAAHGSQQKDRALRQFGRLLDATFRTADPVAHVGGSLFGVLLPETVGESAAMAAEKLRGKTQAEPFATAEGDQPARLTVSIGLASYPGDGGTPDALTRSARTALARARVVHNAVVAATPAIPAKPR